MPQYGFFFDQSRCTGCQTCAVACKGWNSLPPGPLKYLRVYECETGSFPNVRLHYHWIPCYHCERPACVDSCPNEALRKEERYGAVLLDEELCGGCRLCYEACPYGAILFDSYDPGARVAKCTMCVDRLDAGEAPICVLSCPVRALDFGPLDTLAARYGHNRDLEDLPSSRTTSPAVIFKPQAVAKRQLVPYDADRARALLGRRGPLPALYGSASEVIEVPEGMVGRSKLVVKHGSVQELMRCTRNDEG